MTRLTLALTLAFLVGLFAIPGYNATAFGFAGSSDQAQLAPVSYQTVAWHRYWSDDDDFAPVIREERTIIRDRDVAGPVVTENRTIVREERPVVRRYYYEYDPYVYYYGPGFGVDLPFFSFHVF